ncbi:hypothetical protein D3C80_1570390 [compost metagenome]
MGGVFGQQAFRLIDDIEITPVVSDTRDQPAGRHSLGDLLGSREVERNGFFDEEWNAALDQIALRLAMGKGRNADVYGVRAHGVQHVAMMLEGFRAEAHGRMVDAGDIGISKTGELHIVEACQNV